MPSPPELSVVVVASTDFRQVARTVDHLLAQTALDRMEVVIVAASAEALGSGVAVLSRFPHSQVVEVGAIVNRGPAGATGVRAARAPVVAFVEDHAYPAPGWAEALLAAHEGPWAAVTPVVHNANPDSLLSWVNFYRGYLGLAGPHAPGEVANVAWHNTAYKRALLLPFGERLGDLLEYEGDLVDALRSEGHRFYLDPAAQTDHLNIELVRPTFEMFFLRGWLRAAARAERERWPAWRRLVYVLGAPLTPLMYVGPMWRELQRTGQPGRRIAATAPVLGLGLVTLALGEVVGLIRGEGDAKARVEAYEFHRYRQLSPASLAVFRPDPQPAGEPATA